MSTEVPERFVPAIRAVKALAAAELGALGLDDAFEPTCCSPRRSRTDTDAPRRSGTPAS
jgi:hypothetical protein